MVAETEVAPKVRREAQLKAQRPPMYNIIIFNDDYTPMEFVINIMTEIFHYDYNKAASITLAIHEQGQAICATFPKDVAETKADKVVSRARASDHPLLCVVRPESNSD